MRPLHKQHTEAAPSGQHHKGEKHEQFLAAARSDGWGEAGTGGCGAWTLVRETPELVQIMPVLCDRWSCPLCGPRRAKWLIEQCKEQVAAGTLDHFLTLTLRREIDNPSSEEIARANHHLTASFHRFSLWVRQLGYAFRYVWTREHTTAQWPHLHLLTDLSMSIGDIAALWLRATGDSWICHSEEIDTERAASYLAKYCAAEATSGLRPRFARAFSKARSVVFAPFRRKSEHPQKWRVSSHAMWQQVRGRLKRAEVLKLLRFRGTPYAEFEARENDDAARRHEIALQMACDPFSSLYENAVEREGGKVIEPPTSGERARVGPGDASGAGQGP